MLFLYEYLEKKGRECLYLSGCGGHGDRCILTNGRYITIVVWVVTVVTIVVHITITIAVVAIHVVIVIQIIIVIAIACT